MKSSEIRKVRTEFRETKAPATRKHTRTQPTSLIVNSAEDPTTMFTTAGMQPLVPYLMGKPHPGGKRVYNIQGCVRTTDIEEVGDERHLTFFEMMGNRSLGDYFKKEAIAWSWEFLTERLKLDPRKLAVTVFEGDTDAPKDEESAKLRQAVGVAVERISYLGKKDNRRGPAGKTGPCGPDTEIFYRKGESEFPPEGSNVATDPDDRLEVRNNVFMEYYKSEENTEEERSEEAKEMLDEKTSEIIGCAIEIHKKYHNSLTEKQIQKMLTDKLSNKGMNIQMEKTISIIEEGKKYGERYIDLVVDNVIFVELKNNVHDQEVKKGFRQLRAYLELGHGCAGLLLNFAFEKLDINRFNHYQGVRFQQLLQTSGSSYTLLENKNVDTGMGFERISMVVQHAAGMIRKPLQEATVYDTDIFSGIIVVLLPLVPELRRQRVMADHLRTAFWLTYEGLVPSNEGRGYVLRRLIRSMFFQRYQTHNAPLLTKFEELLYSVKEYLNTIYAGQFTNTSIKIILEEVQQFSETISNGKKLLDEQLQSLKRSGTFVLSGQEAFKLYDTYGFPLELTKMLCTDVGIPVDEIAYEQALEQARTRSRQGGSKMFTKETDWASVIDGMPPTQFVGYESVVLDDPKLLKDTVVEGQRVLIFDRSPFYATGGGQVGDRGTIEMDSEEMLVVQDVQKYGGVWLHFVGG